MRETNDNFNSFDRISYAASYPYSRSQLSPLRSPRHVKRMPPVSIGSGGFKVHSCFTSVLAIEF